MGTLLSLVKPHFILTAMNKINRKTANFITKDGASIYYEVYGNKGPIIVLNNGLACPINHWHEQISFFSKNHRVLAYDLRGHHKSTNGKLKKITMGLLASDIMAVFKVAFPNEKAASFWGHSYGVPIALKVAALNSNICESLVLINGFHKNPFNDYLEVSQCIQIIESLKIFALSAPTLSKFLWSNASDSNVFRALAGWTGGFNLERAKIEDIEIYSKAVASMDLPTFFNHFKAMLRYDFTVDASHVMCPSLVIHGDRDSLIPEHQNITLSSLIKNSSYLNVKEGSHCSQLDKPYYINSVISEFIGQRLLENTL